MQSFFGGEMGHPFFCKISLTHIPGNEPGDLTVQQARLRCDCYFGLWLLTHMTFVHVFPGKVTK